MLTSSSKENVLGRKGDEIKPFEETLKLEGCAQENVPFPLLKSGTLHVIYSYHPTIGYKHSQSIASALPPLCP